MSLYRIAALILLLSPITLLAQNVGIGTAAPTTTLDVNGQIRMRGGNPALGKVLMADDNGLTSWQRLNQLFIPPFVVSNGYFGSMVTYHNTDIPGGVAIEAISGQPSSYYSSSSALYGHSWYGKGLTAVSVDNYAAEIRNFSAGTPALLVWNSASAENNPQAAQFFGSVTIDKPYTAIADGASSGNLRVAGKIGIGTSVSLSTDIQMANALGNKIALWGNASGIHYGIGIQNSLLQLFTDGSGGDIGFGYGSSSAFTETMRVKGNGNVGLGTATPTRKLEVIASSGTSVLSIGSRSAFGPAAVEFLSDYGLASQWRPGFIQTEDNGNFTGKLNFYTNGTGQANVYGIVKGMEVRNGVVYTSTGTVTSWSDERFKENIVPFTDGLDVIAQINPVQFQYNNAAPFKTDEQQVGVVAQQLEKVAPYMVKQTQENNIADARYVNNQAYVFLLINAVKELQQQMQAATAIIEKQQQQINALQPSKEK